MAGRAGDDGGCSTVFRIDLWWVCKIGGHFYRRGMMERADGQRLTGSVFPVTPWTVVASAGAGDTLGREAMETVCRLYWAPLYAFIRRSGHAPAEAQDLTQGFFVQLLERGLMHRAAEDKGKLRSFLLGSLRYYLIDEHRKAVASMRGGGAGAIPIDADGLENELAHDGSEGLAPDVVYEKRWAVTLMQRARERLREEMAKAGKAREFELLSPYLSGGRGGMSQEDAGRELGMNANSVGVAVHRLKKRFQTLFRGEVAATVGSEEEVEAEIRHLRSLFV